MDPLLHPEDRELEAQLRRAGRDVTLSPVAQERLLAALGVAAGVTLAGEAAASTSFVSKLLASKGMRLGQGVEDAHRQARRKILDQLRGSGNEQMLKKSVSEMNLSVRARKALQLLNIQTLGDLVSHTEAELMGVKNFGATSLSEVKDKLVEYGLSLRKLDE